MKRTPGDRASAFVSKCKTLMLATTGKDGSPTASYAPYVKYQDAWYVYTSALSRHTQDLLTTPKASVMFIEDESRARNLFARKRYTCPCEATVVSRGSDEWTAVLRCFAETFGTVFELVRPLGDFMLFRLEPSSGRYVEGFGRAYRIDAHMRRAEHIHANSAQPADFLALLLKQHVPVDTEKGEHVELFRIGEAEGLVYEFACFLPGTFVPHVHDQVDSTFCVVAGTGTALIDGRVSPYRPGDVFGAPAGVPHGFEVATPTMLFTILTGHILDPTTGACDLRYPD